MSCATLKGYRVRGCYSMQGERCARGKELFAPIDHIDNCFILVHSGRIVHIDAYNAKDVPAACTVHDLGDVCIAPAVINAHTHIQLSHMAKKTLWGQGFVPWLQSLIALLPEPLDPIAIDAAVMNMKDAGTGHFADYTHMGLAKVAKAAVHAQMSCTLFGEWFGFAEDFTASSQDNEYGMPARCDMSSFHENDQENIHVVPCGHALYSTKGKTLQSIKKFCNDKQQPFSMHLAESQEETDALLWGTGSLVDLYTDVVIPKNWQAPMMRPVAYAEYLGLLDAHTLAVHCVQCTKNELELLAQKGTYICLCPRSNKFLCVGLANHTQMIQSGVALCLGTDGLSSNEDVNVWNEALFLLEKDIFSREAVLRMLTINGAEALKLTNNTTYSGKLEKGTWAHWSILPHEW